MACHKVGTDARKGVGPVLNGVVGRAAATHPDYSYSAAMKDSGLIWDEATLTTYLQAPRRLVPGTKMTFTGLKKSQEIADVIAYLKQFDAQGQQASP
jgi:cytochrome c